MTQEYKDYISHVEDEFLKTTGVPLSMMTVSKKNSATKESITCSDYLNRLAQRKLYYKALQFILEYRDDVKNKIDELTDDTGTT